jgi:hypothetical protein
MKDGFVFLGHKHRTSLLVDSVLRAVVSSVGKYDRATGRRRIVILM